MYASYEGVIFGAVTSRRRKPLRKIVEAFLAVRTVRTFDDTGYPLYRVNFYQVFLSIL